MKNCSKGKGLIFYLFFYSVDDGYDQQGDSEEDDGFDQQCDNEQVNGESDE